MGKWKKTMAAAAAALVLTAAFAGCGDEKSSGQAQSKPAAGQTIRINFPTAGASGALYAVGVEPEYPRHAGSQPGLRRRHREPQYGL